MLIISFCMKKYRAHISRAGLLKLNCVLFWDVCRSKNVLNTSAAAVCNPVHTIPLLEDSLAFKSSSDVSDILYYMSASDPWLDVRNQKLEFSLINYIAIINVKDLWKSDSFSNELLTSNEFKNILSKWYLHYNVSFTNHRSTEHLFSSNPVVSWHSQVGHNLFHHISPLSASVGQSSVILKCENNNSHKLAPEKSEKPSEEQLLNIINRLCHSLLHFFEQSHDFTMYHKNIVFQNNIKGITTTGILSYTQQMYLMKIYGHLHYGKVKVEILKITHHIEDGTVRMRWRVNGISRSKMLMMLWKSKNSPKKIIDENPEWLDGFSVFSVGPDGLIYKHVCDKMIPDDEKLLPTTNSFSSKLLVLLGLSRRPVTVNDLNAMLVLSPFDENMCNFVLPVKTK